MAMVGFLFTKINAEKKTAVNQAVNIESNAGVTSVTELPSIDPKKSLLKFEFNFIVKYEPSAGKIELNGEIIEIYDKEFGTKVVAHWEKDKKMHPEVMQELFNNILSRSNMEAIIISRDMGLPSPIQMPRVDVKPQEKTVEKSKTEVKPDARPEVKEPKAEKSKK
jgi:hypothetical protein